MKLYIPTPARVRLYVFIQKRSNLDRKPTSLGAMIPKLNECQMSGVLNTNGGFI